MIKNLLKTCGLLLLLSVFMISCKKDNNLSGKTDVLTGAWQETGLTGGFDRLIIFEPGGGFSLKASINNDLIASSRGYYSIENDNLKVTVTEKNEKQTNGSMVKKAVNIQLFENGKFIITDKAYLTINCITYPADGPSPTEFKYNKIIPID
ncbi:hypothetical protein [Pedobacter jamesrossensis]|uniref:Lipocalin-like domain-containing protein n=1 Tax=Pedobacter jamesrossensis TaxID=1908238 RepID=A0ABV8NKF8_9SPHI